MRVVLATTMLDSDDSFDYDDNASLLVLSDDNELEQFSDAELVAVETDPHKPPPRQLVNQLSNFGFRPLTLAWYISEFFLSKAKELHETVLPNFPIDDLLVMLQYKKWLVGEVTGDYYDNWPRLRDACGLTDTRGNIHTTYTVPGFTCSICCETGDLEVFALLCNHASCAQCCKKYIQACLPRGQLIRCMNPQCNLTYLHREVATLLETPEIGELADSQNAQNGTKRPLPEPAGLTDTYDDSEPEEESDSLRYESHLHSFDLTSPLRYTSDPMADNPLLLSTARAVIDMYHVKYKWCPSVDCANLVELARDNRGEDFDRSTNSDLSKVPIVKCPSSHEFCFECQYENHLPCPCWLVAKWITKCEDDSETAHWIEVNTNACPQCKLLIEKNGGCNHMTCRKCSYEFCWICFGDWSSHRQTSWHCNRFDPKKVAEVKLQRNDKQYSLERYLHFYKRFSVHQKSMDGDKKTLAEVHKCMLEYMKAQTHTSERNISWNDVQFLSDAIRSLSAGRKTLQWTYVFAYALKKSNFSEIFEGMQDYLNKTVEDLSRLFEQIKVANSPGETAKTITSRKKEIVNLAALVTRRQKLLIECAYNHIQQGSLEFA